MPLGLIRILEYTQLGHLNRLCRVFSDKTPKAQPRANKYLQAALQCR
jgi:hypothetical protein